MIRCIDNDFLREFYLFLLIYLNEGNDFTTIYDFLERKVQYSLVTKFKLLADYIQNRDRSIKIQSNYNYEKGKFESSIEYIKFLKEKLEGLYELKNRVFYVFI